MTTLIKKSKSISGIDLLRDPSVNKAPPSPKRNVTRWGCADFFPAGQ